MIRRGYSSNFVTIAGKARKSRGARGVMSAEYRRKEKHEMAEKSNCLVGKISNSGSQTIKASVNQNIHKGKSSVKEGSDLRNKGKK